MGIIAIGFGFGGFFGVFGALFHMLGHALTKTLMFFGAGNILQKLKTKDIDHVHGLVRIMPITGALFIAGALAITGCPPFSLFLSEFMVLVGGLNSSNWLGAALYVLLLAIIFAAFLYHASRMVFGEGNETDEKGERGRLNLVVMSALLVSVLILGLYVPSILTDALNTITQLFLGGSA
jgi:hydrogenase-4 component F